MSNNDPDIPTSTTNKVVLDYSRSSDLFDNPQMFPANKKPVHSKPFVGNNKRAGSSSAGIQLLPSTKPKIDNISNKHISENSIVGKKHTLDNAIQTPSTVSNKRVNLFTTSQQHQINADPIFQIASNISNIATKVPPEDHNDHMIPQFIESIAQYAFYPQDSLTLPSESVQQCPLLPISHEAVNELQTLQDLLQHNPNDLILLQRFCQFLCEKVTLSKRSTKGMKPTAVMTVNRLSDKKILTIFTLLLTILTFHFPMDYGSPTSTTILLEVLKVMELSLHRLQLILTSSSSSQSLSLPFTPEYAIRLRHLLICYQHDIIVIKPLLSIIGMFMKHTEWKSFWFNCHVESIPIVNQFVTCLISILYHFKDDDVIVKAIITIMFTVTQTETIQRIFLQCQYRQIQQFPIVITCSDIVHVVLQLYRKDINLLQYIAAVIWNLSITEYGKHCMTMAGIPSLLTQILLEVQQNETLLIPICGLIWALSYDAHGVVQFEQSGICDCLIRVLQHWVKEMKDAMKNTDPIVSTTALLQIKQLTVSKVLRFIFAAIYGLIHNDNSPSIIHKRFVVHGLGEILSSVIQTYLLVGRTLDGVIEPVCCVMTVMIVRDTLHDHESHTILTKTTNSCQLLQDVLLNHTMVLEDLTSIQSVEAASDESLTMSLTTIMAALQQIAFTVSCQVKKSECCIQWYLQQIPSGYFLQLLQRSLSILMTLPVSISAQDCNHLTLSTIASLISIMKSALMMIRSTNITRSRQSELLMILFNTSPARKNFLDKLSNVISWLVQIGKVYKRQEVIVNLLFKVFYDLCIMLEWLIVPNMWSSTNPNVHNNPHELASQQCKQQLLSIMLDLTTLFSIDYVLQYSSLRLFQYLVYTRLPITTNA